MKLKHKFIFIVLIVGVLTSGCTQSNPEERAIAIADKLPEVRLISKVVDNMQRADQCTFDKLYGGIKKFYEAEGKPAPEITESQRAQAEAMIQQMGALAKRCQITLSKSAEKESENVYLVRYDFETITDPECSMLSLGDAQVRVDLSTEKAEAIGGSQEIGKYEDAFDELGECAAISMIGFAQASPQASVASGGPGTRPADPHNCSSYYSDSKTKWCCTDSDGTYHTSDTQYTKGTTEYKVIDLQSGAVEEGIKTDSCDGNTLTEWKCGRGNREEHNALLSEEHDCSLGCEDGACIPEEEELPEGMIPITNGTVRRIRSSLCEDSDGNLTDTFPNYYYTKGTVEYVITNTIARTVEHRAKTDSCDGDTLTEWTCSRNSQASPEKFDCPDGCQDGACIENQ